MIRTSQARREIAVRRWPLGASARLCCALALLGVGTTSLQAQVLSGPAVPPPAETVKLTRLPPVETERRDSKVQPASLIATPEPATASAWPRAMAVTYQEEVPRPPAERAATGNQQTLMERLQIPKELPGANVPPLWMPADPQKKLQVIETLFPDLPPMPKLAQPADPALVFTLAQLEQMAVANSPLIAQAEADVRIAMGQAYQVGVYPNPVLGYEADTVGSAGTRNYQGVFGTQVVKTANKLGLARAAANVDVANAELALRRTRSRPHVAGQERLLRRARGARERRD